MIYRIIVFLVLSILMLVGCSERDAVIVPDHFKDEITPYDTMGYKRINAYEIGDVYRCYLLDETSIGLIQSVEAYEEPILIWIVLDGIMVKEVEVLYENESEDYGDYVTERWFLDRLLLSVSEPLSLVRYRKENENEVIAITGATVTSKSLVVAVNESIKIWEAYYDENQ